jgi:hypothetical protein
LSNSRWLMLLIATVLAFGPWGYVYGVLIPTNRRTAIKEEMSGEYSSDLFPPWLGARELVLHGRDPYSPEVTAEIQRGMYGRPLDPRNPADPRNEQRFAYPVYAVFLLAPTVGFPFAVVQRGYMVVVALLSAASVLLWVRALGERMHWPGLAAGMVLLLSSFPVVQGLPMQQLSLLVAALLAGAAAAVAAGALGTAGLLLALAMSKPHLALPLAGWLLVWAGSAWRTRKALPLAFGGTMAGLLLGAELLLPGWFWRWRETLLAYSHYTDAATPLPQYLFGPYLGGVLWGTVLLTLLGFGWQMRRQPPEADGYKLALVCVLSAPLVLPPAWHLYDQILLLPAVLLGVCWRHEFWHLGAVRRCGVALCAGVLGWLWAAALVLALIALASPSTAQQIALAPLVSLPFVPLAVLAGMIVLGTQRMKEDSVCLGGHAKRGRE